MSLGVAGRQMGMACFAHRARSVVLRANRCLGALRERRLVNERDARQVGSGSAVEKLDDGSRHGRIAGGRGREPALRSDQRTKPARPGRNVSEQASTLQVPDQETFKLLNLSRRPALKPMEPSPGRTAKPLASEDRVPVGRIGADGVLSRGARPGSFRVTRDGARRRAGPTRNVLLRARVRAPSMAATQTRGARGLRQPHPSRGYPLDREGAPELGYLAPSARKEKCGHNQVKAACQDRGQPFGADRLRARVLRQSSQYPTRQGVLPGDA